MKIVRPIGMCLCISLKTRLEPKVVTLLLHSKTIWWGFTTLIVLSFKPQAGSVSYGNGLWTLVKLWSSDFSSHVFLVACWEPKWEMVWHPKSTGKTFAEAQRCYLSIERNSLKKVFSVTELCIVKIGSQHKYVPKSALRNLRDRTYQKVKKPPLRFDGFILCAFDCLRFSNR